MESLEVNTSLPNLGARLRGVPRKANMWCFDVLEDMEAKLSWLLSNTGGWEG